MILLKLFLVPGLVALVTLAVRRWGPAVGGWLAGLPIVAGPVLVIYALEQGNAFAARAAHATLAGLIGTVAFALAYAQGTRWLPWYACMAIGWITFVGVLIVLSVAQPGLFASLVVLITSTLLGRVLLVRTDRKAKGPESAGTTTPPRADLISRLIATGTLVFVLTSLAARLGPLWSGLLNAFPVLTTIVAVFSHAQRGAPAARAFLAGYLEAIVGFGLFCVAMAISLERFGLGWALTVALAAQLAWHAGLVSRASRSAAVSRS